jgi:phage baseplate assembly protein W
MAAPYLDFPLTVDGSGRMARTDVDDHVRDMVEQVLFTAPGERVNRPDFGCGLLGIVFEPNSELLAAATELRVRGALQRWLADVVDVKDLHVVADDSRFVVELSYVRLLDNAAVDSTFTAPAGGP